MKVRILKPCGVSGKSVAVDDVVEVSGSDGRYLIGSGKAVDTEAKAEVKAKAGSKGSKTAKG